MNRQRRRWVRQAVAGAISVFLGAGGCLKSSRPDDADAQIAFDKGAGELDLMERYCLRSAQLFCAGLEPCCLGIDHTFEHDICILVRSEHCMAPAGYESPTFDPAAADACLKELEHQFDGCEQPPGQSLMPIALHARPACDPAWSTTDPKRFPRYAAGESCGDGLKLCADGYFCDSSMPLAEPVCRARGEAGESCRYASDCAVGLRCNETLVCEPVFDNGGACMNGEDCASALCCESRCVPAPAVDAHLCWIFNYPDQSYPPELGDATSPCVSRRLNAAATTE